ncbi:MAG: N-acetyl-gamma-glutamyl-phosphate reductase [Candidatus Omnitrophota bacterium]
MKKVKVAVLGATGFTGEKLVEILLKHPKTELVYLASRVPKAIAYSRIFTRFSGKTSLKCESLDIEKAADKSDILFLSLPHTASMEFAPYLLKKGKKVIDLSADYRLKNTDIYKKYYKVSHKDKANLKNAVYGLAEIYKSKIKDAQLIANPGCYPTSIILALYPLLKQGIIEDKIIADSKSAISGAGRKTATEYKCLDVPNNLWAYKAFNHQHTPEIESVLKESARKDIKLSFVPQVIGAEAGIYSTIYVSFKNKETEAGIKSIYRKYYKNCPFIRICKDLPKLKQTVGTNFCDLGAALEPGTKLGVIISSIDNLVKGAAGSAVQNMNIMCGFSETLGLL